MIFKLDILISWGDNKDLPEIMNRKVIPLLLEYFMNDETEVTQILKTADLVVKKIFGL